MLFSIHAVWYVRIPLIFIHKLISVYNILKNADTHNIDMCSIVKMVVLLKRIIFENWSQDITFTHNQFYTIIVSGYFVNISYKDKENILYRDSVQVRSWFFTLRNDSYLYEYRVFVLYQNDSYKSGLRKQDCYFRYVLFDTLVYHWYSFISW